MYLKPDLPKHSSYLIKVLTLQTLMSYNFLTADLIWCLLAFKLVIKTKVLLSSIFFMADSVVRGCLMILWASIRLREGVDFLGYLGFLAGLKVFGLLKCTVVRTFLTRVPWVPFTIFFWTFWAFWIDLEGAFFSSAAGALSAVFFGTGFLPLGSALAARKKNQNGNEVKISKCLSLS